MKTFGAALAAIVIVAAAGSAFAGVVVEEQQTIDRGNGQQITHTRKVMIQGNKQKSVGESGEEMVTDLDAGTVMMVNPAQKAYVQMPFPPKGMAGMTGKTTTLSFKKTGASKKIAGYSCEEYTGSGSMNGNEYTVTGCFSKSAPGSAEFSAFQKTMAQKVKGTPMAAMADVPEGVPLELDSKTKVTHLPMANMSPDQAAKINEMLAKRPPIITHTTVTKVSSETLSADLFQPPNGYQQQQMNMMGGMRSGRMATQPRPPTGGSPAPAAAPSKVPE